MPQSAEFIPYEPRMGAAFVPYEVVEWLAEQRQQQEAAAETAKQQGDTSQNG